jgi:hypothetical protein
MKTLFPYRKFFTIIKEQQEQKETPQETKPDEGDEKIKKWLSDGYFRGKTKGSAFALTDADMETAVAVISKLQRAAGSDFNSVEELQQYVWSKLGELKSDAGKTLLEELNAFRAENKRPEITEEKFVDTKYGQQTHRMTFAVAGALNKANIITLDPKQSSLASKIVSPVMQIKTIDTPKKEKEALQPIKGFDKSQNELLVKTPLAHKFVTMMKLKPQDCDLIPTTYEGENTQAMSFYFDTKTGLFGRKEGGIQLLIYQGREIFKISRHFRGDKYKMFQRVFKIEKAEYDKLSPEDLTKKCQPIFDKIQEELEKAGVIAGRFKMDKKSAEPCYQFECGTVILDSAKFKKMIDIIDNY